MLSDTLIFLGSTVFVLTLLELFLSEKQQKAIADRMLRFWVWLDDTKQSMKKETPFDGTPDAFTVRKFLLGVAASFTVVICLLHAPELARGMSFWQFASVAVSAICAILTGHFAYRTSISYGSTFYFLVGGAAVMLLIVAAIGIPHMIYEDFLKPRDLYNKQTDAVLFVVLIFGLVLMLYWFFSFGFLLMMFIFEWAVRITEVIIRRLSEYPKGPILALSAAFTGAVAFLKIILKSE